MLPVTLLLADLFAQYSVNPALALSRFLRANRVALGAGSVVKLVGVIRVYSNIAVCVLLGLILLVQLEGVHPLLPTKLFAPLVFGCVLHARALASVDLKQRTHGMVLTFAALSTLGVPNSGEAVRNWLTDEVAVAPASKIRPTACFEFKSFLREHQGRPFGGLMEKF